MSTRVKRYFPAIAVLVVVALLPALAAAQTLNLSGTWTFNADMSQMGGGRGGMGGGGDMMIKQEGAKITITQTFAGRDGQEMTRNTVFTTDGKPTEAEGFGGRGGGGTITAKWDGKTLVVTTARDINGQSRSSDEKYTLSSDGKTLTIESSRPGRDGSMTTTKRVYNKK